MPSPHRSRAAGERARVASAVVLPKRPDIAVRLPAKIYAGDRVPIEIEIDASRDVKLEFLDARLTLVEGWYYNQTVEKRERILGHWRFMEAGVLPEGTRRFTHHCALPDDLAPSHEMSSAYVRLRFDIHASIPWWPDGHHGFLLPLHVRPRPAAQRVPVLVREPFSPRADDVRVELSLASSIVAAGEALTGSCALFHADTEEVEVAIEPRLQLFSRGQIFEHRGGGFATTLALPGNGTTVPFSVRLPADITPSFVSTTHQLDWVMQVTVGSFWRKKRQLEIPLVILDAHAIDDLPPQTFVPQVADARVVAMFERVAQRVGVELVTALDDSGTLERPALVQARGDVTLHVGFTNRPKVAESTQRPGSFVVGRIRYPRLGLQLRVHASSFMRELVATDIEVDDKGWDSSHRVAGRDPAQIRAFLQPLVRMNQLRQVTRWDDQELVVERSAAALTEEQLAALFTELEAAAEELQSARAQVRPPSGLTIDLDAWRELARRLDGLLVVGDLSIEGRLDGLPCECWLAFDDAGAPLVMNLEVGDPERASAALKEVRFQVTAPRKQASAIELVGAEGRTTTRERVAALLATWPDDVIELDVGGGVARACLPIASAVDAQRMLAAMRALRALLAACDESAGPYR
jgi:hypothetical protein